MIAPSIDGARMRPLRATASAGLALAALVGAARATTCDDLCAPSAEPCVVTGSVIVTPAPVIDCGPQELRVGSAGSLFVRPGDTLQIHAGNFTVQSGGSINGRGSMTTRGGSLLARITGACSIQGPIDLSGAAGGSVTLQCGADVTIAAPISTVALNRPRSDGDVTVTRRDVAVSRPITAAGTIEGEEGSIQIRARRDLTIAATIAARGGTPHPIVLAAGGFEAGGNLTLADGSPGNASSTRAGNSAGEVAITAGGDVPLLRERSRSRATGGVRDTTPTPCRRRGRTTESGRCCSDVPERISGRRSGCW